MSNVSSFIYRKFVFPDLMQTSDFENINLNLCHFTLGRKERAKEQSLWHIAFIFSQRACT